METRGTPRDPQFSSSPPRHNSIIPFAGMETVFDAPVCLCVPVVKSQFNNPVRRDGNRSITCSGNKWCSSSQFNNPVRRDGNMLVSRVGRNASRRNNMSQFNNPVRRDGNKPVSSLLLFTVFMSQFNNPVRRDGNQSPAVGERHPPGRSQFNNPVRRDGNTVTVSAPTTTRMGHNSIIPFAGMETECNDAECVRRSVPFVTIQ